MMSCLWTAARSVRGIHSSYGVECMLRCGGDGAHVGSDAWPFCGCWLQWCMLQVVRGGARPANMFVARLLMLHMHARCTATVYG